jgi:hypothetical protein
MLSHFPNLCLVTNDLDPALLNFVGRELHLYSVDVQTEYQAYREFQLEYEQWLDDQEQINYLQDY